MNQSLYDVAIVGAGAAGLMTALQCEQKGLKVLLLDSQKKIGAKILMSGGTRCNVTNETVTEADFASDKIIYVRNILKSFRSQDTVDFFEALNVHLVKEDGGKLFPSTHSGRTILEAFLKEVDQTSITLLECQKISGIQYEDGFFKIQSQESEYNATNIVLATGGLSYPTTGSDGSGYKLAESFGHSLIKTIPALTPLKLTKSPFSEISGASLPARLTLFLNQKKQIAFEGPLLFTHFGLSGPTALNMSRHWLRAKDMGKTSILVSFLPKKSREELQAEMKNLTAKDPGRTVKSYLRVVLPERFSDLLLTICSIPIDRTFNQLKKDERSELIRHLVEYPIDMDDVYGYSKAEVTAGGISLDEVDYRTMESKLQPGLFFAGEILDADGRIGGFNFQWAWATGHLASVGIAKRLAKPA